MSTKEKDNRKKRTRETTGACMRQKDGNNENEMTR